VKVYGDPVLADVLGGPDGGWAFYAAGLAGLEAAIARSRERRDAFTAFPVGEFRRLLRDVDEALSLAVVAVDVQHLIDDGQDGRSGERQASLEHVLAARLLQARDARDR
jgi:hypothetical protein